MNGTTSVVPTVESFRTSSGIALRLTRWRTGRNRVVLVVPGLVMYRECAEIQMLAERLARSADVVTVDVRGHGDSGGRFTWGRREPDDIAELAAALRREYARLGAVGFSFGGYNVAVAAALHRSFDAVAMVGAPHRLFVFDHNLLGAGFWRNVPILLRRRRRWTRVSLWNLPRRDYPSRLVHRIAPVPLLIAHGTSDWLVHVRHARILFDRAAEPKQLVLIEDGLHAESLLAEEPERLLEPLHAFFAEHLA